MPSKSFPRRQRRMKDQEGTKEAFSTLLLSSRGPIAGLERVSLKSQLRTRPPTEKSRAAPQAWLRAWAGPVHPASIHFWPPDDDETGDSAI
jgi:hypothetical protein